MPTLVLAAVIIIALFTVPDIYNEHRAVIAGLADVAKTNAEAVEHMSDIMDTAIQVIEDRQILEGVDVGTGEVIPN